VVAVIVVAARVVAAVTVVVAAVAVVVVIVEVAVVEIEIEDPAQAVQETDVIKIVFLILISPDLPGFVIYNCRR
jgi:hypothetical protein